MCDSLVVGVFPNKTKTRHKFCGVCVVSVMHWGEKVDIVFYCAFRIL